VFQREGKGEPAEQGCRDPSWFTCTSLQAAGLQLARALAGLFATDQVGPGTLSLGSWGSVLRGEPSDLTPTFACIAGGACRLDVHFGAAAAPRWGLSKGHRGLGGDRAGGTRERCSFPWQLQDASGTVVLTQGYLSLSHSYQILS